MLAMAACSSKVDDEVAKAALKAADYAELNNLMSLHSWYHAAFMNGDEIEKIWSKRDDIIWAQSMGYWKGKESIMNYYGVKATEETKSGGYVRHTITSGVVEIAEDRQTAKGIWYTPGGGGMAKEDGTLDFGWMWEKYGVDFIREDGQWKIWHMKVYTDWAMPLYESGGGMGGPPSGDAQGGQMSGPPPSDGQMAGPPPGDAVKENAGDTIGTEFSDQQGEGAFAMGKPDYFYKEQYKGWARGVSPQLVPRPPEPYKTWSETWSYVDEGE